MGAGGRFDDDRRAARQVSDRSGPVVEVITTGAGHLHGRLRVLRSLREDVVDRTIEVLQAA